MGPIKLLLTHQFLSFQNIVSTIMYKIITKPPFHFHIPQTPQRHKSSPNYITSTTQAALAQFPILSSKKQLHRFKLIKMIRKRKLYRKQFPADFFKDKHVPKQSLSKLPNFIIHQAHPPELPMNSSREPTPNFRQRSLRPSQSTPGLSQMPKELIRNSYDGFMFRAMNTPLISLKNKQKLPNLRPLIHVTSMTPNNMHTHFGNSADRIQSTVKEKMRFTFGRPIKTST